LDKAILLALTRAIEDECCARAERPVVAGGVTADGVAELATGLPTLFVQGTPCMRVEAEALGAGTCGERPAFMGEWVVHM